MGHVKNKITEKNAAVKDYSKKREFQKKKKNSKKDNTKKNRFINKTPRLF